VGLKFGNSTDSGDRTSGMHPNLVAVTQKPIEEHADLIREAVDDRVGEEAPR